MSRRRLIARLGALLSAAALVFVAAAPASAHVTISPEQGTAGSYTVLTVSVPHGCEGSPTTRVAVQIPEEILSVAPTRHPLWEVEKVMTKLDQPVTDSHGNKVTERVGQVVYTADTPLPDGQRDTFELSLQLPDTPGATLTFPTIQTCEEGETAWVQVPADGQSADELDTPAPAVEILAASGDEAATAAGESSEAINADAAPAAAEAPDGQGTNGWGIAGLIAGLLGLAAGVAALVQVRRRA